MGPINFRHALAAIHSGAFNSFAYFLLVYGVRRAKPPFIPDENLQLPRELVLEHFFKP